MTRWELQSVRGVSRLARSRRCVPCAKTERCAGEGATGTRGIACLDKNGPGLGRDDRAPGLFLGALCLHAQRVEPLFQAGGAGAAVEQPAFADIGAGSAALQVFGGAAEAAAAGGGEQHDRLISLFHQWMMEKL